jgi:cytochrome subunit of sulfide dehydrogenase
VKPKIFTATAAAAVAVGAFFATPTGTLAAGMAPASMLANTCNACHGPDGSTYGPAIPSISGTNMDYLVDTMQAYKSGQRKSTIMGRIAKGYTDEEIGAIAKHFSKQKLVRQVMQKTDSTMAAKGQELSRKYCQDCHEKDGYTGVDYPSLAGQPVPYLTYQLADFLSGSRNIDDNPAMSKKEKRKKKRNLADLKAAEGDVGFQAIIDFYGSRK